MGSPHVYTLESGIPGILNYHSHDYLNAEPSLYVKTAHGPGVTRIQEVEGLIRLKRFVLTVN